VLSDVKPAKQRIKVILAGNIVIVFQHRQEQAFPETAWRNRKRWLPIASKFGDVRSLVGIDKTFHYHFFEIAFSVGNFREHGNGHSRIVYASSIVSHWTGGTDNACIIA
jgi:hypothetical protein